MTIVTPEMQRRLESIMDNVRRDLSTGQLAEVHDVESQARILHDVLANRYHEKLGLGQAIVFLEQHSGDNFFAATPLLERFIQWLFKNDCLPVATSEALFALDHQILEKTMRNYTMVDLLKGFMTHVRVHKLMGE